MNVMTTTAYPLASAAQLDTLRLKKSLRLVERRKQFAAFSLIAPLVVFLLIVFVVPVVALLARAVDNPEVVEAFPATVSALDKWQQDFEVPLEAYPALINDLSSGTSDRIGAAASRLNREHSGFRSLIRKTSAALPLVQGNSSLSAIDIRSRLIEIDSRWAEPAYWRDIARNGSRYTSAYMLTALDHKVDDAGHVVAVEDGASNYQGIFARTFLISATVTLAALLLGYPLAYWIAGLPTRKANLVLILVLLPFWTSILVRIAAWIVLLQGEGLVNKLLMFLGLTDAPLPLLFNRVGVLIAMTHILLPFMVLPLYSVMKSVPATYHKAAVSLGSHPFGAFWKVYVPQTYAGVGAGAVLVFILALGYYITPALLGGAGDQM
ncbi:MAG: ABC transporter permease, partial [Burkholderiaceae bacterium]